MEKFRPFLLSYVEISLNEKGEKRYVVMFMAVRYICLKIKNYYLKIFVKIRVSENMCENT